MSDCHVSDVCQRCESCSRSVGDICWNLGDSRVDAPVSSVTDPSDLEYVSDMVYFFEFIGGDWSERHFAFRRAGVAQCSGDDDGGANVAGRDT